MLRDQLYSALLQSFATAPKWPETADLKVLQKQLIFVSGLFFCLLKADLDSLVTCWNLLEADKLHCRDLDSLVAKSRVCSSRCKVGVLFLTKEAGRQVGWRVQPATHIEPCFCAA